MPFFGAQFNFVYSQQREQDLDLVFLRKHLMNLAKFNKLIKICVHQRLPLRKNTNYIYDPIYYEIKESAKSID